MNLEKATVCCELTTLKLPCLHSILRTVGWSGTRHRWRNEMGNELSPSLCVLCYLRPHRTAASSLCCHPSRKRGQRVYTAYI